MLLLSRKPGNRTGPPETDMPLVTAGIPSRAQPKIGLALGAGAARGWSHIGIVRELEAAGIRPDVVVGTSIGAVVGGFYAAGKLDELEEFARSLTRRRLIGLLDLSFSGTAIFAGARLRQKMEEALAATEIGDLPLPFAAVATEIGSGHEIWLREGSLITALSASYALPGILEPIRSHNRWLFDGALVNPVPVSVCRALGADIVIAVSLVSDTMFRGSVVGDRLAGEQAVDVLADKIEEAGDDSWWSGAAHARRFLKRHFTRVPNGAPGIASVLFDAFTITQDRIARSRLAGDPPDILMSTRLDDIGLFDFHKAQVLITRGREAAHRRMPDILDHIYGLPARAGAG